MSQHKDGPEGAVYIDGWRVYPWPGEPRQIEISEGPRYSDHQEATLGADSLDVDVHPDERGGSWDGGYAIQRVIPTAVLREALRQLDVLGES